MNRQQPAPAVSCAVNNFLLLDLGLTGEPKSHVGREESSSLAVDMLQITRAGASVRASFSGPKGIDGQNPKCCSAAAAVPFGDFDEGRG